jgi:LacI family transcriptional regulator
VRLVDRKGELILPTIIDVAREAGVSFKTVSRVFTGEAKVRPETRDKVRAAAARIGYEVNPAARALRSKAPRQVGLLLSNPSRSYSETTQIGALLATQKLGSQLVVLEDLEALKAFGDLKGVVACPPLSNDPVVTAYLQASGQPFVRVGAERISDAGDKIGIDDRLAAREMTEYLIGLGHERIGFIEGDPLFDISRRRKAGFEDAMSHALCSDQMQIISGSFSYQSGLTASETLLSRRDRPTAIFAANDEMASACLAVAYKLNLRVPEQLSVVGFDDSPVSRAIYPALTTVRQGLQELVSDAFVLLSNRLGGDDAPFYDIIHQHDLIIRDSAGPPEEEMTRND